MKTKRNLLILLLMAVITACNQQPAEKDPIEMKVNEFTEVRLESELVPQLSDTQKEMVSLLIDAAKIMDDLYWKQTFGSKEEAYALAQTEAEKAYISINYGPWDRLHNNEPFIEGIGEKPAGANFYPSDMTPEEFEALQNEQKTSLYTILRRDDEGALQVIPYPEAYGPELEKAAALIKKAAALAEDEDFKKYLNLRAEALLSNEYLVSDMAWMDMKNNQVDFVVGPIENYEDALFNYKAAFESFVLIKDMEWSQKLGHFSALLPRLQQTLPVAPEYKTEVPGSGSDMGVYEAIYYAGDCNAGGKTIAINLPNDERVHIEKGSRKLQLKNAMRFKFEKILVPIADLLIAEEQRQNISFDAFFENTMFHEVAHGLGIKNTINDKGTVRAALKEQYSPLEEGKADIVGLYLVSQLYEMGELGEKDLMDNYVTFMAGIFRSVRFGVASAHGKANMVRFNYFMKKEAFTRDPETGTYRVDFEKMTDAMNALAEEILVIQGNGDYDAAKQMLDEMGVIKESLQADLDRIGEAGIPRDIRFIQGKEIAGL